MFSCLANADSPVAPPLQPLPTQTNPLPDPLLNSMWHLQKIGAQRAWKTCLGDPNVTVAIVDSGVDYNHPDLALNIRRNQNEWPVDGLDSDLNGFIDDVIGWDFVKGFYLPFDRAGHGTFMASIIAARHQNGIGGSGVCPLCTVLPLRFINWEGLGDTEDAIQAIYYAADYGASVINISFSGEGFDKELKASLEYAGSKDAVVVVSASNDDEDLDKVSTYPAKFQMPHLLTVTSSDPSDDLVEGANWGKKTIAFAAPGEDILGIWFNEYSKESGTSQAAAVTSGAAALVRSANRSLTAKQTASILKATARFAPGQEQISQTEGILDVEKAVVCATTLDCLK